jgi:hypothetical protein
MIRKSFSSLAVTVFMSFYLASAAHATAPEDQLVGAVKVALGKSFSTDWSGLDALPEIKWAPLPPVSLQNCLPDGGCFTRQGVAAFGDRSLMVIASGARTVVTNIYFRGNARPMGETVVLDALKQHAPKAIIHVCASSEVFGRVPKEKLPIDEECSFHPASPYAISKVGTDLVGRFYAEAYGMTVMTTRMFTHTGPRRGDVFCLVAGGMLGRQVDHQADHRDERNERALAGAPAALESVGSGAVFGAHGRSGGFVGVAAAGMDQRSGQCGACGQCGFLKDQLRYIDGSLRAHY